MMKHIFLNRSIIPTGKKIFLVLLFILIVILNFFDVKLISLFLSFVFCYSAVIVFLKNKNGIKKIEIINEEIYLFNTKDNLVFKKQINDIKTIFIPSTIICFEFDKESIYFDFGNEINDFKEVFKKEPLKKDKIFSFSNFIDLIDIFR